MCERKQEENAKRADWDYKPCTPGVKLSGVDLLCIYLTSSFENVVRFIDISTSNLN